MPELPEVETVVRDLRPALISRRIDRVRVSRYALGGLRRRWNPRWGAAISGRTVQALVRRGKWIQIVLDGDIHIVVHLGMTGQLTVVANRHRVASHTHVRWSLDGDGPMPMELRFRDVRRFGSVAVYHGQDAVAGFYADSGLGPEPFGVDGEYWNMRLAGTQRSLKAALLDQRLIAGVGNIYADEALFEARLDPARRCRDVHPSEARRLRKAVEKVLRRAIEQRGSSIRDYIGGTGLKGRYQDEFRVYQRTGLPCCLCRTPIQRTRLAGRASHFCPNCQGQVGKRS